MRHCETGTTEGLASLETATQYWTGTVFFAISLALVAWMFSDRRPTTEIRRDIVHVICALCAGLAGLFISGGLVVDLGQREWRVALQGSAGLGLAVLTFRGLRQGLRRSARGVNVSIGTDTPFHFVAEALAEMAQATVDLSALQPAELDVLPSSAELPCGTLVLAHNSLEQLGKLVPRGSVRPYRVTLDEPHRRFTLVVLEA